MNFQVMNPFNAEKITEQPSLSLNPCGNRLNSALHHWGCFMLRSFSYFRPATPFPCKPRLKCVIKAIYYVKRCFLTAQFTALFRLPSSWSTEVLLYFLSTTTHMLRWCKLCGNFSNQFLCPLSQQINSRQLLLGGQIYFALNNGSAAAHLVM